MAGVAILVGIYWVNDVLHERQSKDWVEGYEAGFKEGRKRADDEETA